VVGVLIAANEDPLPSRREIRRASSAAAEPGQTTSPSPDTFATAWSNLMSAIGSAQGTGDLDEHAADELAKHADELANAYREGDAERVSESLTKLEEELTRALEEEEISSSSADAIDQAILDLVLALQSEGVLATASPPPTSEEGDEDSSGPGSGDEGGSSGEGHGPPGHAEANGHDGD
jgi:hypothetical protein